MENKYRTLSFYDFEVAEAMYSFMDCYPEQYNYFWNIKAEDKIYGDDLSLAEYIYTYAFQEFKAYAKDFWHIEIIDKEVI